MHRGKTEDEQGDERLARRHDETRGRPSDKAKDDPVVDLESDERVDRERLEDELRNVNDGSQPRILCTPEVGIRTERKDGGLIVSVVQKSKMTISRPSLGRFSRFFDFRVPI